MSSTRPDLKFTNAVDERLFHKNYDGLPPKENNVVRLIDHKDYFTALEEDAVLVADAIYKTQLVIKTGKHKYVTISPQVLVSVLRHCLVENSYKVEMYSKSFELLLTATPGNLEGLAVEYGIDLESMAKDGLVPMVASLKFSSGSNKKVGVALADLLNRQLYISEFEDNELFANVELLFLQLNVKEAILPANYTLDDSESKKLLQALNKINGLVLGSVKPSYYSAKDIDQDLPKIVQSDVDGKNTEMILASKGINSSECALSLLSCSALIHYLNLLNGENTFALSKYNLSTYMKLDSLTMRALNIFPQNTGVTLPGTKTTVSSIYELLNKCKTASGSRLLSQWLKQPLTDMQSISDRHELVRLLIEDTNLRVFLTQEWLVNVPDIKRLFKKLSSSRGSENKKLEDVVRLYQLGTVIPQLLEMLSDIPELGTKQWVEPITEFNEKLLRFQEMVETTVDLSPLQSSDPNQDFSIKPEFDETLVDIDKKLNGVTEKLKEIHLTVADDLCIDAEKKLKLEKHQIHGWCFRVTRIDSSVLRNKGGAYIELQTVKAGVFFTTKEVRLLAQEFSELQSEYNAQTRELVTEIVKISLTYQTQFLGLLAVLSEIDVLCAFANVAIFAPTPYTRPKIHAMADTDGAGRSMVLKQARHPVLEVQDDISFIANDVEMGDSAQFVIITGPNMGGKSTYIRQIGVVALMSQVGCFVPVDDAEVPIFDAILSRVGAGDSQIKGFLTFMIEMLETSLILATATRNSLVIIDELGRGTSTYDGFGLAWAISEHLIKKRCFTLFATHFHELTKLGEANPNVSNLHVVAHVENADDITLMYKVEPGVSDKLFGIHVAELVKFPAKIVNMAKRKALELLGDGLKKSKCSDAEITAGVERLREVLKEWKDRCSSDCTSDEAIGLLKDVIDGSGAQNDKFVQEIMAQL